MLGNAETAEDIAQEVFVAAYKGLARFRGDSRFSTWLITITINRCRNQRQRAFRRKEDRHQSLHPVEADDQPMKEPLSTLDPPDAATHRREVAQRLESALATLSDEYREIIVLRDFQDLDYPDIAEILQIARGTVKSRLSRARAKLRDALGNPS
jgi:RNA polymerase sigma-70 factor (ECF subfamily)